MPYRDPEQDSGGLLTEDQVMALVNSMYQGGGSAQREYQPLQASGYTQAELYDAEDAKYYPPARDSSGRLMNPGEPNPPIVAPPSMASPERIRQWETLQAGVRKLSPEEAAAGQALAVRLENQYTAAKKNAEEAGQDQEFTKAFLMTTRVQDATKAIQAAKRFQAMRQYQRDVKGGMPTIEALNKNPGMYYGDAGITAAARLEAQPAWELNTTTTPEGSEATTFGPNLRVIPPRVAKTGIALSADDARELNYVRDRINDLTPDFNKPQLTPEQKKQREGYQARLSELETKYGLNQEPAAAPTRTIAPPPGVTAAPTNGGAVFRFKKDPKTGKAIRY